VPLRGRTVSERTADRLVVAHETRNGKDGNMSKVAVSVILAVLVGGAVVVGVVGLPGASGDRSVEDFAKSEDVAALRQDMRDTLQAIKSAGERIDRLEASHRELVAVMEARPVATAVTSAAKAVPAALPAAGSPELREFVFAAIQEERKVREEEQQRQREEMRQRMEERRKEYEALREGPYDRYNVRVNSITKALGLNDAQRDGFYELTKKYTEKFQEARTNLRQQEEGQGEGGEARGPGGRGGRGRQGGEQYRELVSNLQKEYAAELETMLTGAQLDAYNGLSERSQSFMYTGMAVAEGEEGAGFFGRMGGMPQGGRSGMFQGGRRGGGRGGR
jgi:hypothetical protein